MSIRQVQIENVFDIIAKSYLMDGQNPLLDDIYKYVNKFFAQQPVGTPYRVALDVFRQKVMSDPEVMNDFMAMLVANIDTLYETCFNHIDQILVLNTVLRNHLDRLKIKRSLLTSRIEDYLLGIYNSDGYFYSTSDDFSATYDIDFNYTNAFIDVVAGVVTIPAVSTKSRILNPDAVTIRNITVTDITGKPQQIIQRTNFNDALDGLSNTSWYFEVKTNDPSPLIVDLEIGFSTALSENIVTKVDLIPFGVEPIQVGINARFQPSIGTATDAPFSSQVQTSSDKMVFVADQPRSDLSSLKFQIKKNKHDYDINDAYERTNVYIFGFKDIIISEQYFDPDARFVSLPFSVPPSLSAEAVIDAVSMTVKDHTPTGTSIQYYVAADNPDATTISDFQWQRIEPLTDTVNQAQQIVRFNGTRLRQKNIRLVPRNDEELTMFPLNSTNVDPTKRNPTPAYFSQVDAYRIAPLLDEHLLSTVRLEEGINSTRIYYTELATEAYTNGFEFWRDKFDAGDYLMTFGEMDTGHGYFYGADVGENGKSIYAETYVYVDEELPVILKDCRKSDLNSRTWDVKVYLNGREIASLPAGVNKLTVPWKLKQGKNHVVVMANIPSFSSTSAAPYIGSFDIMADAELYDYGTVKLEDWVYVDPYKFEFNLTNDAKAFTIYNNEIVTRNRPTNNFRVSYNNPTSAGPEAIRVRADLRRSESFSNVTPIIDSYRVRFAYAGKPETT